MLEMEKPVKKRAVSSKHRPRDHSTSSNGGPCPLIVCQASSHHHHHQAAGSVLEAGVVISFIIMAVHVYGFYETFQALPEPPQPPAWDLHRGENLNLAVDEWRIADLAAAAGLQEAGDKTSSSEGNPKPAKHRMTVSKREKKSEIPEGKWPVSIRDEHEFETMTHPGDEKTEMSLPRFWSPPVHHNQLMSRSTAMKIGTCSQPDPQDATKVVRGDKCPLEARTIFLAIASYRDFQCRLTIESAFSRAAHPERLRVGVVDQIVVGEDVACNEPVQPCDTHPHQALCQYADQVDVYTVEAALSIGPVFARHIGYRMYRGEYYTTQSDAHVTFTQNWDLDIIGQMEATQNEMAVLSTYLTDIQGSIDNEGHSLRKTRPIMCNTYYEGGAQGMHLRHGSQPERFPSVHGTPQLQPWWAAGYSFSRGHFVVNVPYDPWQPMIFQGEEMSIGIRGYTIGYDFYAPERSVCFHHYAVGKNAAVRNKVHHFWENDRQYRGTGKKAMARLLGIVHMNPEVDPSTWDHRDLDSYGLGEVRTPEQFYQTFGIDVVHKTTEGHLCKFVDNGVGKMHHLFTPHLRKDGMGIDYSKIDYKFKDPTPGEK